MSLALKSRYGDRSITYVCMIVTKPCLSWQLLMVADDFCVERRVCVDMSKIRATKKLSRGFEPQSINLVQGELMVG